MNKNIENCLYQAGLTAQGCWDELDDYAREGIEKFAELIVKECINEIHVADVGDLKAKGYYLDKVAEHIEKHFGVQ
jgi:hypothetical protein